MLLSCVIRAFIGSVVTSRRGLAFGVAAIFTIVAVGEASPIGLTDTVDPGRLLFSKKGGDCVVANGVISGSREGRCQSVAYTHTFDSAPTSAFLAFAVADNGDTRRETLDVYLDGARFLNNIDLATATATPFDVSPFLADTNVLSVVVRRGNEGANNNFWFGGSTLRGERNGSDLAITAIPEPASVLLLGSGLLMIARRVASRHSTSRKA